MLKMFEGCQSSVEDLKEEFVQEGQLKDDSYTYSDKVIVLDKVLIDNIMNLG